MYRKSLPLDGGRWRTRQAFRADDIRPYTHPWGKKKAFPWGKVARRKP